MKHRFQAEEGVGPWWFVSLLVHGGLFAALLYMVSKESWTPQAPDAARALSMASPEKIGQVAEDIRVRESEALRARVEELLRLKEEMSEIQKTAFERLNEFQLMNRDDASKNLADAQRRAVDAETEAARKLAAREIPAAREKQEQAGREQNDALRLLEQMREPGASAAAAQREAVRLQQEANAAREAENRALQQAQTNNARLADAEKQLSQARDSEKAARELRDTGAAQVAAVRDHDLPVAEKAVASAAQAIAAAGDGPAKAEAGNRRAQADQKVVEQRKTLEEKKNVLAQREREAAAAGARVKQLEAGANSIRSDAGRFESGDLQKAAAKATATQTAALDSQRRAAEKVAALQTASAIVPPAPTQEAIDSAADIPAIYDTARRVEDALAASYQDARAAELAALQHLPIGEARKLTQTARPVRPDLDKAALTGPLRDAAGLEKQEQQILTAQKEVGGMVSLAKDIIKQAQPGAGEGGATVSVASLKEKSSHASDMENAALANENSPARDLTGLMKKGSGTAAASGSGPAGENKPAAKKPPAPVVANAGPPQLPRGEFKAVPGRRLTSGPTQIEKGRDGSWMFLDSWYIIGPWPNQNRRNLNTKFPPESIINLDATYLTESGKRLAWHFFQSGTEEIIPPGVGEYEICYAYTELRSETECDRWIAIGSDDQSKIWINDELVWKSSDILKGWNPGEGLRKIHLKQGANRILLRLENGWYQCGFSIIVKLTDA